MIPHLYHGKDKSFFFFAYERYSLASIAGETATVFPQSWENGDFSQLTGQPMAYCRPSTIPTPRSITRDATWTRQTFTQEYSEGPGGGPSNCNGDTNCIPLSRLSPTGKRAL